MKVMKDASDKYSCLILISTPIYLTIAHECITQASSNLHLESKCGAKSLGHNHHLMHFYVKIRTVWL